MITLTQVVWKFELVCDSCNGSIELDTWNHKNESKAREHLLARHGWVEFDGGLCRCPGCCSINEK